jgi:hypothetical protein
MKKYLLFAFAAMLAFSLSAAARLPQVTLRVSKNYEVTIDGQTYKGSNTLPGLSQGYHQVQVYSTKGFILKQRTLVSSSSFNLRNNDVLIDVDENGQLHIYQDGSSINNRNGNYDDRNYDDRNGDWKGNKVSSGRGNGWGPYDNPGRGHKYGLYKNKDKKNKKNHDKDWDDRDND